MGKKEDIADLPRKYGIFGMRNALRESFLIDGTNGAPVTNAIVRKNTNNAKSRWISKKTIASMGSLYSFEDEKYQRADAAQTKTDENIPPGKIPGVCLLSKRR